MKILHFFLVVISLNFIYCLTSHVKSVINNYIEGTLLSKECLESIEPAQKCAKAIFTEGFKIAEEIESNYSTMEKICDPSRSKSDVTNCKKYATDYINRSCELLQNDACKEIFTEDFITNFISNSKCLEENNPNVYDNSVTTFIVYTVGINLLICSKTASGNSCPIVDYIINSGIDHIFNNFATYSAIEIKSDTQILALKDLLPKELTVAIGDTCREKECNKKIKIFDKLVLSIISKVEELNERKYIEKEFPNSYKFYNETMNSFRNSKCSSIDGGADSGTSQQKKITYSFLSLLIISALLLI